MHWGLSDTEVQVRLYGSGDERVHLGVMEVLPPPAPLVILALLLEDDDAKSASTAGFIYLLHSDGERLY